MMFRNMSFQLKMFIIIFTVVLTPVVIVSFFLYDRSEKAITDQTSKVVISSISYAITNIDSSLDNVTGMSKLILTDQKLIKAANRRSAFSEAEKTDTYRELLDLMQFFITRIKIQNMIEGIDSFYLYLNNQNTILDVKSTYYENVDESRVDFIQHAEQEGQWYVSDPVNYYTLNRIKTRLQEEKLITFNRVLKDNDSRISAILAVNVSEQFLSQYYKKIQRGVPGEFIVLDSNAAVVATSMQNEVGSTSESYKRISAIIEKDHRDNGSFFMTVDRQKQFIVYSQSPYSKWKYIVMIPSSQILGKVNEIKKFLYVVVSLILFAILAVSFLLARFFNLPLRKLVWAMQKTGNGRLDVRIKDGRGDEYKAVYQGFNDMMDQISLLIHDLASEKLLKKEAEIKLLQAQINPHFLYNTLDSIYSIAKINKVEEISLMVSALSKFFRVSLSGGRENVTLKESVDIVISYLTILNIRYKGKISFDVDVPPELADCIVPKLILQPIVENAVYHGIQKNKDTGHLLIAASSSEGILRLVVEDDGVGIAEEELLKLRQTVTGDLQEETLSYALRNLYQHIKLKYGPDYGLHIDSEQGRGTRVTVSLPVVPQEVRRIV
ncbi:sensor histidine kinase [Cohnella caldifontis]|uniref:sensor histidine kinase n=1 Tax=Cohnella caldifontis TaxID=3027471 RepID=UPI0023EA8CBE|nr:sensor histidine kinase [Cohnella sp. YIM B05605]